MGHAFELRLELLNVTPQVWRRLRVPSDLRLDDLHYAIQALMGWDDFHPHVFEVSDSEYGPRIEVIDDSAEEDELLEKDAWAGDEAEITIAQAFAASPGGIIYIYDFDDDWRVRITPERLLEADADGQVVCLGGGEAGPQQETRKFWLFTVDQANARLRRARRPRPTPQFPAGPRATSDQQLLAHLTLVVLMLGSRPTRQGARESPKQVRAEVLESLQEAGLIEHDPARRGVTLTDAGVAHARRLLQKLRAI
jgi:hypothetical protein